MSNETETKRKWKVLEAIFRGELLLRLDMGRFLIHILFFFFAILMIIWASMGIDATMSQVEKNRAKIEELRIEKSRREFEIMHIYTRSTIATMLKDSGSDVTQRDIPAIDMTDEVN